MTSTQPLRPRRSNSGMRAGVAATTLAACAVLAAMATPMLAACAGPPVLNAPAALAPADSEMWPTTVAALGVQVCDCRAAAPGSAWAFVAPRAALFDAAGHAIGRPGTGPRPLLYTSR